MALKGIGEVLLKVFGSRNERVIKGMLEAVEQISRFEPTMRKLSDNQLRGKTEEFRNRFLDAFNGKDFTREQADQVLEKILPEAFAVVREASCRVIRTPDRTNPRPMRHFDVQLIGGMVLHGGAIAEMVTGEGKTLVATLAVYLNAIPGKGVHIVTVNDYLARRDCEWMGPLYQFLGLTTGVIQNSQEYDAKRAAYACDITFGKDSEFGFDYLRDNMRWTIEEQVQRHGLYYAIVDEVDSVLVDEARTPLIISGSSEGSTDKYYVADRVARKLRKEEHFLLKEKEHSTHLTESGVAMVEKALNVGSIYSGRNADWPHHIEQALRAHHLYRRDDEYVCKNGEIIIVDEFTGRLMSGRRWSDGLHQAIEAKEGLRIKEEDQTLATVTYQNFFRMYQKLAGMTGTAMTEASEFAKIYGLDVISIPTNLPLIRSEYPDLVYRTSEEKYDAIAEEVVESHATGRPILVGTTSIEKSELLSKRLDRRGIKHEVLNAKHHEREAQIVFQAGHMGHVTIATNMAGRGTDIMLGEMTEEELLEHWKARGLAPKKLQARMPREELEQVLTEHWAKQFLGEDALVKIPRENWSRRLHKFWEQRHLPILRLCTNVAQIGGLHIVGTERHEARRIDNQLRGRAGRQGDPGSSRFFLSLEDDLMRIFASDKVSAVLKRIGMEDGMAIESRIVTGRIETAQKRVEEHNFEIRKHLLEYAEVMDEQRKTIYDLRQQIIAQGNLKQIVMEMIEERLNDDLNDFVPDEQMAADRNGRPLCEWAHGRGMKLSQEQWQSSDLATLKQIFRSQEAGAWANSRAAIGACIAAAMDLFAPVDQEYFRWNTVALSRWARHLGLALEAEDMEQSLQGHVLRLVQQVAATRYAERTSESVIDVLVEQAAGSYLSGVLAIEECDLQGLAAWADVLGVSMSASQWMQSEDRDAEDSTLASQLEAIRNNIRKRLERSLRRDSATDAMQKTARHEVLRRIDILAREEKGGLGRVASWLEKSLDIIVPDSEIVAAIATERESIIQNLTRQLASKLGKQSNEEQITFCADTMLDTFLALDLAATGRDLAGFCTAIKRKYGVELDPFELSRQDAVLMGRTTLESIRIAYEAREQELGSDRMRDVERYLLLKNIDTKWKDHLLAMDHLRGGIGLRGYAQVDPKVEYAREARILFEQMQASVRQEVSDMVLRLQLESGEKERSDDIWADGQESHPDVASGAAQGPAAGDIRRQQESAIAGSQQGEKLQPIKVNKAPGRNDPCHCGSGKKFKKCHGRA